MPSGFVWDPAGPDRALAQAVMELKAQRAGLARETLRECRRDYSVRSHRSLLLASIAAGTDLAETWLEEDPQNSDAKLLYARVAMVRALRSREAGDGRESSLALLAWRAAVSAIEAAPWDPTPWSSLIAVARHRPDVDRARPYGRTPPPQGLDALGPWDLLTEAHARQPWHRESYHRMLAYFYPRYGGDSDGLWQVASWAATVSPPDADAQLLPLVAQAEQARTGDSLLARDFAVRTAEHIYTHWFPSITKLSFPPIADLSLLAHALDRGGRAAEAGAVLEFLSPYAASFPWSLDGRDPARVLAGAYARSAIRPP
jgi:hypothetical protein